MTKPLSVLLIDDNPARAEIVETGLAAAGYTLAVIDTPGADTAATAAAMHLADLSLVPVRASALDLEAARPTVSALVRLGRSFAFVLNSVPSGRSTRL